MHKQHSKEKSGLQFPIFFDAVVAVTPPEPPAVKIDSVKDIVTIIYTGGTTGVPKGAALTHANIVFNINALDQWM